MNSSRPYLVNALIDWIVDNGCTPHVVLDVSNEAVDAPTEFANGDRLVLNIAGTAVRNFKLDADGLTFDARFKGEPRHVSAPVGAIVGIFARENGHGMAFEPNTDDVDSPTSSSIEDAPTEDEEPKAPSHLRLIKD